MPEVYKYDGPKYDIESLEFLNKPDNSPISTPINYDAPDNETLDYKKIESISKMLNYDMNSTIQNTRPLNTLPLPLNEKKKKTVVLDLDNTLVHASFTPIPQYDFLITVPGMGESDDTLTYHVQKRPGVDLLLQRLSEYKYEIIVFTSAEETYADAILNKLEMDNNITIEFRLYKDSCTIMEIQSKEDDDENEGKGNVKEQKVVMVKDLARLGRDLKNVIIVDDDPAGYTFQPENAVSLKAFKGDLTDRELWKVMDLCRVAVTCGDVREAIRTHAFITTINEKYACSLRQRQLERERMLSGVNLSKIRKTIVVELFEVLVSTSQSPLQHYDFIISSVTEDGETETLYVSIRPGVLYLFTELRKNFEIIVFTESRHETADVILGKIDVNFDISRRFYRGHCKKVGDGYVKDLKKIGLNLCNAMIVDVNPGCYKSQPENGISIRKFEQRNVNDKELYQLADFCSVAASYQDLRRAIWLNRGANNAAKESPANEDGDNVSDKRRWSFF
ncbi:hypothetical protein SUGI_0248610 [Cryptomeria japonica]|nr:hypothetical protein SUGI_0248610 [Cryptomeria japonica]